MTHMVFRPFKCFQLNFVVTFFLIQCLFILPTNLVRSGSQDRGKGSSDWVGKINTPNMTQIKMPINVLEGG